MDKFFLTESSILLYHVLTPSRSHESDVFHLHTEGVNVVSKTAKCYD